MQHHKKGRMDAKRTARSESEMVAQTVVRRLGFLALKAHEVIMSRLIEEESPLAVTFQDAFKPLVDAMVHFEIGDDDGEV